MERNSGKEGERRRKDDNRKTGKKENKGEDGREGRKEGKELEVGAGCIEGKKKRRKVRREDGRVAWEGKRMHMKGQRRMEVEERKWRNWKGKLNGMLKRYHENAVNCILGNSYFKTGKK